MSRKNQSKGDAPARTQGARRATGESGGSGLAPGQRWSAGRKREVVLRSLRGESLDALSRELGVEIYRLEKWRERALAGMDLSLKNRQDAPLAGELNAAKRHIGELSMEVELLRERARAAEGRHPLATRRSREHKPSEVRGNESSRSGVINLSTFAKQGQRPAPCTR